ncbi:hypothetical protein LSH36_552g01063 [Paralvinella palmiformis]|uniref:Ubiquitin-like-conjugating enzyme ATG10 n=1 Tax=Paralvinella palmiformis TaxID=53620 RepID=A0AAD9MX63_9ANNE|nr:hypothetical protein LSH36_552g01063 [Paralvinella palmiformis]
MSHGRRRPIQIGWLLASITRQPLIASLDFYCLIASQLQMAGCSTYVLTEKEFTANANQLISISNSIGDNWQLHHFKDGDVDCYLSKRLTKDLKLSPSYEGESVLDLEEENEVEDDVNTLSTASVGELCTFEYHVMYSSSYAAPVLYFTAYWQDGHLLSLEDLWASLSKIYQCRLRADRWTFVTQQEHPVLHRPFYQLHPCKTGLLMALMRECKDTQSSHGDGIIRNMLVSWLSTVGPVVHLDIPVQYGISIQDHK